MLIAPGVPVCHVEEVVDELDVEEVASGRGTNHLPPRTVVRHRLDTIEERVHPENPPSCKNMQLMHFVVYMYSHVHAFKV